FGFPTPGSTHQKVKGGCHFSKNSKKRKNWVNPHDKGFFDFKCRNNQVAARLNFSKHTVYLYIRQFKSGDFQGQDK
ncbi:helix-turn-helix domain-containing protein, partial [Escherichia coli]|nr:helix-turn-helix domain-containing protein [Escherichia coli]